MAIEEGFYDAVHIQSTDKETGEICWFHWREFDGDVLMMTTFFQIAGGAHDGAKIRKQLWFDDDMSEKGGERRAWDALDAMGFKGDNIESLEESAEFGRNLRVKVYTNKNGYSEVGWIGAGSGGGAATVKGGGMDDYAKKRFAAKLKARRRGGGRPPAGARPPAQPDMDDIPAF